MKKSFIISVLAVLLSIGSLSAERKFDIIPHVGFGQSGYSGKDAVDLYPDGLNSKFAFQLGVDLNFPIKKIWSFQTGLNFSVLGAGFEESFAGSKSEFEKHFGIEGLLPEGDYRMAYDADCSVRQLYLEVPVMAAVNFKISRKFNLLINAGPYLGIGLGGKSEFSNRLVASTDYSSIEEYNTTSEKTFGKDGLNRVDVGIGFGVKFEVKRILFGVDCHFGLLNLSDSEYVDGEKISYKVKNESSFLTVGYRF